MVTSDQNPPATQASYANPDVDEPTSERRTLRDYIIILRERFWIALPLALLVSVGLGFHKASQTPLYSTAATLRFEKPQTIMDGRNTVNVEVTNTIDLNTYLQELASGEIRGRVVRSLSPDEVRILQRPYLDDLEPGQEPPSAGAAMGQLSVNDIRDSYIIRVGVTHPDGEAAALVANRYVDEFMNYILERRFEGTSNAADFLKDRADQLRLEAEAADRALQDYQRKHDLISLDDSTNLVRGRLQKADEALTAARLDRIRVEQVLNQVETYIAQNRNLLEISYISQHGSTSDIALKISDLRKNQSILAERYLERHPKMILAANEIAITEQQLQTAINEAIADLRSTLEKAQSAEAAMLNQYNIAESEQRRLNDLSTEYDSLLNQAEIKRGNFRQISERLVAVDLEKRLENVPVQPLDRATQPGTPFTPHIPSIIQTSIMVFFVVFIGVAVGLSFIDDRIKSAWDVENFIGVNLLGIVPDLSNLKDEEKYSMVLENRQTPGTESFLSVYSAAKIHSKLDFPKSILVTSTIPGEGKTLISCNLAGGFARHGRKTLLVDCDLRRPMLHRHFQKENDKGLIPWFEGGASFQESMHNHPDLGIEQVGENLCLLRSGGRSRTPTEILESKSFGEVLERLQKEFELIVVDSPPLGAVTDSMLIADQIDEVIYVCRFNRAYKKHIRQYIRALQGAKKDMLGIVLNGLSPRRIEYYSNYRYYRSYKKYYGAEA
ncbi:MAG: exopolysaccharide regulatory tyrosine autokinase VpsO [Synoicihabitans sp.]